MVEFSIARIDCWLTFVDFAAARGTAGRPRNRSIHGKNPPRLFLLQMCNFEESFKQKSRAACLMREMFDFLNRANLVSKFLPGPAEEQRRERESVLCF